ncbi:MAG: hypothetical protein HY903_15685 [Deltaproteobacteria bacterium]|nr:hypothetical protein [Deltaproteobacteria bacterium]
MMLQVLAVGMLDWQVTGVDRFFVQINPTEVMLYEVHRDGQVNPVVPAPAPLVYVTGAVEKFGSMYRLVTPVPIQDLAALPALLGKFEIVDPLTARYVGSP